MDKKIKVQLVSTNKPPACQGTEASKRNIKLWNKVKGMIIEVGESEQPNS